MSLVRLVEKSLMEGLPVWLHFPRSSLNEWICSEGLLPTKDILKQSQVLLSIRWLSFQLLLRFWVTDHGDCHFREESLEKMTVVTVLSLPRGVNQSLELSKSRNTRFTEFTEWVGRQPAAWAGTPPAARGIPAHISRLDWGVLKMALMVNGRQVNFNSF